MVIHSPVCRPHHSAPSLRAATLHSDSLATCSFPTLTASSHHPRRFPQPAAPKPGAAPSADAHAAEPPSSPGAGAPAGVLGKMTGVFTAGKQGGRKGKGKAAGKDKGGILPSIGKGVGAGGAGGGEELKEEPLDDMEGDVVMETRRDLTTGKIVRRPKPPAPDHFGHLSEEILFTMGDDLRHALESSDHALHDLKSSHDAAKRRHKLSADSLDRTVVTITLIGGENIGADDAADVNHPGRFEDDAMARAARLMAMSPTASEAEKAEKAAIDHYHTKSLLFSDEDTQAKGAVLKGASGAFAAALQAEGGSGEGGGEARGEGEGGGEGNGGEAALGVDAAAVAAGAEKRAAEGGGSPRGKHHHNKVHHTHHLFHHFEGGISRRTPLLDGSVTCSVLRVSMSDRSKRHFPPTWEGYWSAIISPVYFGKQTAKLKTKRDPRAWAEYRGSGGAEIDRALKLSKVKLRDAKRRVKEAEAITVKMQKEIDGLVKRLGGEHGPEDDASGVGSSTEEVAAQLKAAERAHEDASALVAESKDQVEEAKREKEQVSVNCLSGNRQGCSLRRQDSIRTR